MSRALDLRLDDSLTSSVLLLLPRCDLPGMPMRCGRVNCKMHLCFNDCSLPVSCTYDHRLLLCRFKFGTFTASGTVPSGVAARGPATVPLAQKQFSGKVHGGSPEGTLACSVEGSRREPRRHTSMGSMFSSVEGSRREPRRHTSMGMRKHNRIVPSPSLLPSPITLSSKLPVRCVARMIHVASE